MKERLRGRLAVISRFSPMQDLEERGETDVFAGYAGPCSSFVSSRNCWFSLSSIKSQKK